MTSDPGTILRRLAAVVAAGPDALWAALHEHAPGWVPTPDDPGRPNREYTKKRESRWRLLSVLVGRILARRTVTAAELLAAAELWPEAEAAGGEQGRRGRMPKQEQWEKKARMLALLKEHDRMKDDPETLASMIGASESTTRRWLKNLWEELEESDRRRREDDAEE